MSASVVNPRLRFVVKRPVKKLGKPIHGRTPSYVPLLIAFDWICRRGAGERQPGEEGFFRRRPFKRGPTRAAISEREALINDLARDWHVTAGTVEEYLTDDKRFYYPLALSLVDALTNEGFTADIERAVAEHRPGNEALRLVPLADGGLEFNLLPHIRRPKQPKKRVEETVSISGRKIKITR
jgi:hypothetical protein